MEQLLKETFNCVRWLGVFPVTSATISAQQRSLLLVTMAVYPSVATRIGEGYQHALYHISWHAQSNFRPMHVSGPTINDD